MAAGDSDAAGAGSRHPTEVQRPGHRHAQPCWGYPLRYSTTWRGAAHTASEGAKEFSKGQYMAPECVLQPWEGIRLSEMDSLFTVLTAKEEAPATTREGPITSDGRPSASEVRELKLKKDVLPRNGEQSLRRSSRRPQRGTFSLRSKSCGLRKRIFRLGREPATLKQ